MYGSWLFMQSISDAHTKQVVNDLWANIAQTEGWEPLEATLEAYGDTLGQTVVRYHLQNLVRDYDLAPDFEGATVWLENTITDAGNWSYAGRGIQELAANYFKLDLADGIYTISLNSSLDMTMWAVGIRADGADAFALDTSGSVDVASYDEVYLVVVNLTYDSSIDDCDYGSYSLDVEVGGQAPKAPVYQLDTRHFVTLQND
jgi:hypothetical protein